MLCCGLLLVLNKNVRFVRNVSHFFDGRPSLERGANLVNKTVFCLLCGAGMWLQLTETFKLAWVSGPF